MTINLSEQMLTIRQAAQRLPGKTHASTIHRWMSRGSRGIQLESLLIGGTRYTSVEALDRFVAATTAAADGHEPSRVSDAHHELDRIGI